MCCRQQFGLFAPNTRATRGKRALKLVTSEASRFELLWAKVRLTAEQREASVCRGSIGEGVATHVPNRAFFILASDLLRLLRMQLLRKVLDSAEDSLLQVVILVSEKQAGCSFQ